MPTSVSSLLVDCEDNVSRGPFNDVIQDMGSGCRPSATSQRQTEDRLGLAVTGLLGLGCSVHGSGARGAPRWSILLRRPGQGTPSSTVNMEWRFQWSKFPQDEGQGNHSLIARIAELMRGTAGQGTATLPCSCN